MITPVRILMSLSLSMAIYSCAEQGALRPFAQVEFSPINEMSGISHSSQWPGVFWVHNDSGDDARIFALDGNGNNIIPASARQLYYSENRESGKQAWQGFAIESANNRDWEDITIRNNILYLADVGNNNNRRQDLTLYRVPEFNPASSFASSEVTAIPVRYPDQLQYPGDQLHFDSESLFAADDKLYLITKHRSAGIRASLEPGAKLYRLDTEYTDQDNMLTLIGNHSTVTAATGAELSPDGQTLAVVSYTALWLFERPDSGDNWLASNSKQISLNPAVFRQVEAVSWVDDEVLIVSNEQRDLFHLNVNQAQ